MNDALGNPQSVLVLGAGSEIAQAITVALVAERCRRVVLAARRPDALADHVAALTARGATVETVAFDADDLTSHRQLIDAAFDAGDIDAVVMAFAVLGDRATYERDPAVAAAIVHTNLTASVSIGLIVADRLRRQGHGTLVVLSSVAGERVRAVNYVYGATKAGLDGFAQGLNDSLAGSGAHVLVVRPGFVRTKMTTGMREQPLTTGPDAVAEVVVRGLRSGAHTVWSPTQLRWIFMALRHLPRPLWRRMPR